MAPTTRQTHGPAFTQTARHERLLVLAGPTLDRILAQVRIGTIDATPIERHAFLPGECVSSLSDLRSQDFSLLKQLGVVTANDRLHLMVPSRAECHRMNGIVSHVGPQDYPPGSFMQVAPHIIVPCWELYFMLRCRTLPTLSARLLFGEELCGRYSHEVIADERTRCHYHPSSPRRHIEPATTPHELASFLDRADRMRGVRIARDAVRRLVGNAASPMESVLAQMLSLSRQDGGYGFSNVQLNPRVDVPADKRHLTRRDHFYPDVYLAEIGDDLEYESKEFHPDDSRIADAERRNDIQALGIRVVTITPQIIGSFERLELVVRQVLEKAIEQQGRPVQRQARALRREDYRQRRRQRLHELLPQWWNDYAELGFQP